MNCMQRAMLWLHTTILCVLLFFAGRQYHINQILRDRMCSQANFEKYVGYQNEVVRDLIVHIRNVEAKHHGLESKGELDKLVPLEQGKLRPLQNRTNADTKVGDKITLMNGEEGIVIAASEGHNDGKTRSWNSIVIPTNGQKYFSKP